MISKSPFLVGVSLAFLASSCSKQDQPSPSATPAQSELAAVLAKHNASISTGTTSSNLKASSPKQLDSLLTVLEKGFAQAKLVKVTAAGKQMTTNRTIAGSASIPLGVALPSDFSTTTGLSDGTVFVVLDYTYCTGDGNYRSASLDLSKSTFQATSGSTATYTPVIGTEVVRAWADQVKIAFYGEFSFTIRYYDGSVVTTSLRQPLTYTMGLNDGQTIIDGDYASCSAALPVHTSADDVVQPKLIASGQYTPPGNPVPTPIYSPSNPNPGGGYSNPNPGGYGPSGGSTNPGPTIPPPGGDPNGGSGSGSHGGNGGGGGGGSDNTGGTGHPIYTPEVPQEN